MKLDPIVGPDPLPRELGAASGGRTDDLQSLAREFEAILMAEILQGLSETMQDSSDEEAFGSSLEGVLWTELANHLTAERGLGLGDAIHQQLREREGNAGDAPTLDRTAVPARTATPAVTSHLHHPARTLAAPAPPPVESTPAPRAPVTTDPTGPAKEVPAASPESAATPPPAAIRSAPASGPAPVAAPERMAIPVEGRISSRYGPRIDPFHRQQRFHRGLDLAAAEGTDVRASEDGRVVFAGRQSGYGNVVIVEHGAGVRTLYAHLSEIGVSVGDPVRRGEPLGAVGSTGRATGPHLHFEVRRGDGREDPEEWL